MGMKDILRFMKPYVHPIHINTFSPFQVGIDAYSKEVFIHRSAYSCSMELCLNAEGDQKKFQYINYCLHRINMLRHHNITPVLVFDGCNIPCKSQTDKHFIHYSHFFNSCSYFWFCSKRKENRELAMVKLKEGDTNAAVEMFQRAVSITPSMAYQLIQVLRSENIEFVVAPYEADAQLAYLSSLDADKGGIAAVISEDSDLLAYGCTSVIFKMDRYGSGEEIVINKVFDSLGRLPSFLHFNKELFSGMCVLAGCDFLPSVPGIGIGKAHALVSKYRNLDRVLSMLKFEKGDQMPKDYLTSFKEALAVFQHARIYDADSRKLKHLTPLGETLVHYSGEELDFLGPELSSSQASAIAEGQLDPCTMKAFNELPGCDGQLKKPTAVNNLVPNRILKKETTEGCFTIVSSRKTGTKKITVVNKTKPDSNFELLSNLKQLISPLNGNSVNIVNHTIPAKRSSVVPNNNPFKRQKQTVVIDDCASEYSEVTEVEDLEMTPDSQSSVESKFVNKTGVKKIVTSGKKVESKSESNKNTILNFFSRV
ncbi:exonuclease 1-like [Bidens hawaiensis]|uniref:exonuclease 1-like n=1 Tax=Bidens hawaiensis TaxID=980011 RepID=UPI00404A33D3